MMQVRKLLRAQLIKMKILNKELPDTWTYQVTGNGIDKHLNFHYYWIDLETANTKLAARLGDSIEHLKKYLHQGEVNESN